jgi:pSer/pThr/pTyr-binding forkhead associated (FHA) protein
MSNGAALIGQFYAERNREYPVPDPVMSVGRANANTLRIRDERIAAHHIRIERDGTGYVLEVTSDDASTTLNGEPLRLGDRRPLKHGDLIGLADLEFRFTADPNADVLSRLWVVGGVHRGKTFRIDCAEVQIGRAADNDVQFPDRSVSRHHCRIRRDGPDWCIEDLGSTNGTYVAGEPVRGAKPLNHGDEVVAGFSRFVFQDGERPLADLRLEPLPPCN